MDNDEPAAPDDTEPPISKKPVEVTADDLADEEWGPVKGKTGKKEKGKKGGKAAAEEEEEDTPEGSSSNDRAALLLLLIISHLQSRLLQQKYPSLPSQRPRLQPPQWMRTTERTTVRAYCPRKRRKSSRKSGRKYAVLSI